MSYSSPEDSKYSQESRGARNIYSPIIFALVLIVGMQLGYRLFQGLNGGSPMTAYGPTASSLPLIDEVYGYIDAKYVDTINTDKIAKDVIKETLKNLDPHSYFIDVKELKRVNEELQGNFDGIGVEFSIVKDTITVVTPIAGGPSEALGIRSGDKVISIEDTIVAGVGITNRDVMAKLRGKKGTKVRVGVQRKGISDLIDYTITRDKIPLFSVDAGYMMDEDVGYIKINRFSATTYNEFNDALIRLLEGGMQDLILDLRQNPGGYLTAATTIADDFLGGSKLLVYTEGRNYLRKEYKSRRRGLFEEGKLVVLIDQGSASASEILAGAVQDWDRGTIIGRRSFGKGLVQEQYNLRDGSAMRLTVARYYTPLGRCIQKPYEEGVEDYQKEIYERIDQGELYVEDSIKVADSIQYITPAGKVLYGGGGIMPDHFIPLDTTNISSFLSRARSYISPFAYNLYGENQAKYDQMKDDFESYKRNYQISDQIYDQFRDYIEEQDLKLKDSATEDEKEALKKLEINDAMLQKAKPEFKNYIKSYLAKQIWNYQGFYPIINETDNDIQNAYEFIRSGTFKLAKTNN